MGVLVTVSTPWLVLVARVLRAAYADRPVHVVLVSKGDAPGLRNAFDRLVADTPFASVSVLDAPVWSRRLRDWLGGWPRWVAPGGARRAVGVAERELVHVLERTAPRTVLVGNKFHAAERALLRLARRRGLETGLVEEGLSIYQRRPYWEASPGTEAVRRLFYRYHGVADLYGPPRHVFDTSWLSCPEAYPHHDVRDRRPLAALSAAFATEGDALIDVLGLRGLVDGLAPASILLLSQRLSEDRLLSPEVELALLAAAIRRLGAQGETVYVKPHPREAPGKLERLHDLVPTHDVRLLDIPQVPVEILFGRWRPRLLAGFMSGTLVYGPRVFGIPAASFAAASLPEAARGYADFRRVLEVCGIPALDIALDDA